MTIDSDLRLEGIWRHDNRWEVSLHRRKIRRSHGIVEHEEPRAGVQSQNDSSSVFLACQDYVFQTGIQNCWVVLDLLSGLALYLTLVGDSIVIRYDLAITIRSSSPSVPPKQHICVACVYYHDRKEQKAHNLLDERVPDTSNTEIVRQFIMS